jgi:uracil-DNA glycosylase
MEKTSNNEKLDKIHQAIRSCHKCRLHLSRTIAVPGQGPLGPDIMFLGEAPGKAEDLSGLPFVGRSGIFFNNLLSSFGIDRQTVYITSAVKCRPPANRNPFDDELQICKNNWLDKQISLVDPKLIVMLGKVPLKQIFNRTDNLDALHGRILEQNGRHFLVTFHPAAAMRFPKVEKKMKEDFEILKRLV